MDNQAIEKLLNHPEFLSLSNDQSADIFLWIGDDGRLLHANQSALVRFGLNLSSLRRLSIHDLDSNFKADLWLQHWEELKRQGSLKVRVQLRDAKGNYFPVEISDSYCRIDQHEFSFCIIRDIGYRDQQQQRIDLMQFSIDQMTDTVLWIDQQANILFANDAACRNLGYAHDELNGMTIADIDPNYPHIHWQQHWAELKKNGALIFESEHRTKIGNLIPIEVHANFLQSQGEELNVAFIHDISERKAHEQKLIHVATHDSLTGLPNRGLLNDRIEQALARAKRNQSILAVLMIDLDKFKLVNDSYGHDAGDQILTATALRMRSALRATDTVARQGGDEFVILLEELTDSGDAEAIATKLLRVINKTVNLGPNSIESAASIGIAYYPDHGYDAQSLLKHADIAMYQAKHNGRGHFQIFHHDMSDQISRQVQIIDGMQQALEKHEFELHYQPVYRLSDNKLVSAEALLRWRHPDGHLIPPMDFIPIAEDTGLIVPIGNWVIEETCRQIHDWTDQGYNSLSIAVNLSARQLRSNEVINIIKDALKRHNLTSNSLSIELTESMMMDNPEKVINILEQFKTMGVGISIDDFGTGYSSLSYLQRFPVDIIKIDRSFVQRISKESEEVITNAVIQLGHGMGYKVIAEGIENEVQQQYLLHHDCDLVQGFKLGRPEPADQFVKRLYRAS